MVEKLFKLFALVQSNSDKTITTSGIGLGLSVTKQLVEKLGGNINISTAPNQGTEVVFVIPFKCKACHTIVPQVQNQEKLSIEHHHNQDSFKKLGEKIFANGKTNSESISANSKKDRSRVSVNFSDSRSQKSKHHQQKVKQPFGGDFKSIYGGSIANIESD